MREFSRWAAVAAATVLAACGSSSHGGSTSGASASGTATSTGTTGTASGGMQAVSGSSSGAAGSMGSAAGGSSAGAAGSTSSLASGSSSGSSGVTGSTGASTGSSGTVACSDAGVIIDDAGLIDVSGVGAGFEMLGLGGSGPGDVWAVGFAPGAGAIFHWDGGAWSQAAVTPYEGSLHAVWAASSTDAWAGGAQGQLASWDGTGWTTTVYRADGGDIPTFLSVSGSGPADVWAAGTLLTPANAPYGYPVDGSLIVHWDGVSWSTSFIDDPGSLELTGVWSSGAGDAWAVGTDSDGGAGVILHWDGGSWAQSERLARGLVAIAGDATGDLWAVGQGEGFRRDGATWEPNLLPIPQTSTAWVDATGALWVGGVGNFPGRAGTAAVARLEDCGWEVWDLSSLFGSEVSAAWGSSPTDVWAISESPGAAEPTVFWRYP